jgi:hypothetical protein
MPPTTTTSAATPPGVPAGTLPTSTSGYTPPGQPAGTLPTATTSTTTAGTCQFDYQRADNMWAPAGVPKGSLGTESIALVSGQKQVFLTDWKYEKLRNDGARYYGSHLRTATNRSGQTIRLTVRGWVGDLISGTTLKTYPVSLNPNTSAQFRADLVDVLCQ